MALTYNKDVIFDDNTSDIIPNIPKRSKYLEDSDLPQQGFHVIDVAKPDPICVNCCAPVCRRKKPAPNYDCAVTLTDLNSKK